MGIIDRAAGWLRNPHYAPAAITARGGVSCGTMIWGLVVLSREHALNGDRFVAYASMLKVLPEDAWACIALCLSILGAVRLFANAPPHWTDGIGYFVMMIGWNYFALSLLVDYAFPLPPATMAGIAVVAVMSLYAFLSNARPGTDDGVR